ncbi:MAG: hypothetical protein IT319_16385 [Anaerolineae bacterium]|nr:hypothetical protein [Anaerolineae bacterium]
MIENPLRNLEVFEMVTLVGLGIFLLLTLEPVSALRLVFAVILAGVLLTLIGISLFGGHRRQH